jgi:hypothetical protein
MYIVVAIIAVGSVISNIALVALNFKLYTEYFKDRSKSKRE